MIVLALAMMASGVSYPADVQQLIARANDARDNFVNAPVNPATERAAREYDRLEKLLNKKGWCWGTWKRHQPDSQLTWLPCSKNRYGQ